MRKKNEIDLLRFYGGDIREKTEEGIMIVSGDVMADELWGDAEAYRTLNARKSSNMSTGQQKSPHFQRGLSGSCKNNKCIKNQDFLYLLGHSF